MVRRRQAPPPETPPPEAWPAWLLRPPSAGYRPDAIAEDVAEFMTWQRRRRRWLIGAGLAVRLDTGAVRIPAKVLDQLDAERRRRWPITEHTDAADLADDDDTDSDTADLADDTEESNE